MSPVQLFVSFAAICAAAVWLMFYQAEQTELVDSGEIDEVGFSLGGLIGMQSLGGPEPQITDASQTRQAEHFGWAIASPGVIDAADQLVLIDAVLDGYPTKAKRPQRPAEVVQIEATSSCDIRPLRAGEVLANVLIGKADVASDLHAYSDAQMAADTTYWLNQTMLGSTYISDADIVKDHPMPIADVIVTDTSGPVYLLLQHQSGAVLWNIHTAAGVQIAHIAMLGDGPRALSAPQGDHSQQALDRDAACTPVAARQPAEYWTMVSRAIANDPEQRIKAAHGRHASYDAWFRATFAQGSEERVIGAATASHLLVGPVPGTPEARVAYRPIKGATVQVTPTDHVLALPKKQRVAEMIQVQRALATAAAGGDLAMLFPEPMHRNAP